MSYGGHIKCVQDDLFLSILCAVLAACNIDFTHTDLNLLIRIIRDNATCQSCLFLMYACDLSPAAYRHSSSASRNLCMGTPTITCRDILSNSPSTPQKAQPWDFDGLLSFVPLVESTGIHER